MKLLAIVSSVVALAVTAGAVVLVQQEGSGLPDVMGWKAKPAPGESLPNTQPANQPAQQSTGQSAKEPGGQIHETAPVRRAGEADAEADTAETALAALGELNQRAGTNGRSTFDIARINPDGVSVFAGQGKPFQSVSVLADGVRLGTAKVDANGEWVLVTEKKIASADPELSIEVGSALTEPEDSAESETAASASGTAPSDDESGGSPEATKSGEAAASADSGGTGEAASAPARVAARAAGADQNELTPKVREINEKMLDNLQKMVDSAARDKAGREQSVAVAAGSADGDARAASEGVVSKDVASENAASESSTASSVAEDNRQDEQQEPREVTVAVAGKPVSPRAVDADRGKTVPIPIQFVYREATFTPDGEKAADLLLQYVKLGKFPVITLSGHADERGSPGLNMALSKDRLETVEKHLRSGGYKGRLILLPKGETEPYSGVDRASLAAEDLYQLDRRVELHLEN